MELSCPSPLLLPTLLPNRTPFARPPHPLLLPRPKSLTFLYKSGLRCRASEETSTFVSQFDRSPNDTAADKTEEIQVELVSSEEEEKEEEEGVVGDGEQSVPAEFLNKLDHKVDHSPINMADKIEEPQPEAVSAAKEAFTVSAEKETVTVSAEKEAVTVSAEKEEVVDGELSEFIKFLNGLDLKLDSDDTYSIFIYGTGALVALWLLSSVVGAIDSIPVFSKVMQVVGLAYTVWFSYRYLIFKQNREELFAKIEDLKEQIIGTSDG